MPWAAAALLAACATQPVPPPQPVAQPSDSPVFGFREAPPAPAAENPALAQPLDATSLPPFEGEREVVREPLRGLATIDRTVPPDDLWQRIRQGFAMPDLDGPLVQERTAWYAARPDYLKRTLERSRRYLYHIVEEIEKRGLPTELALLPMVESSFNPMAYSRAHASGLWQFIPGTGKRYELTQNWWYDGRRDIVDSTAAALEYLRDIYEMHGDWHLALASYNWGENAVARAIEKNRAAGQPTDYASLTMPAETRHYVPKLQALKNIITNPEPFGFALDPIPNQPYFATVTKTRDIDVALAAKLAEMPVEEFVALNPGFSRPVISVSVSSRIVLPADKVEVFRANLEKHDDKKLVSWQTYRPKNGEHFDAIARKFKVPLATLLEVNGVTRRMRHPPDLIVVPVEGGDAKSVPIMYAPPIPAPGGYGRVHVVRRGDTLWGIAQRYGVSVDDLRRWNAGGGRLMPGQRLAVQPAAPAAVPRSAPQGRPAKKAVKPRPKQKKEKGKPRKIKS
jgi:membrane-bound lytic murein transglycosylase D